MRAKGRTLMVSDWPPSANDCGEASNHDVPDANDSGGSGHTHSKSDSCHVSIIRRCEQDDSLVPTKRLHDVVRTNGCGVTTAGFSGDNTPLVVYPLVVEWADRMVFHIEYGSHRHKKFVHSFWLKPEWNPFYKCFHNGGQV